MEWTCIYCTRIIANCRCEVWDSAFPDSNKEDDMSKGHEHAVRRTAQARAAAKPENKARAAKYPGKGNRNDWKKES